jgi:IS5 family transposase
MYSSPLNSLIETLVESIHADAAAVRERYVLRQALQAMVRLAQVEQAQVAQVAQARDYGLRVSGLEGVWHKAPQQACRH